MNHSKVNVACGLPKPFINRRLVYPLSEKPLSGLLDDV